MHTKTCTSCGVVKPLDAFHLRNKSTDARVARCKLCAAAYCRRYYATNAETLKPEKAKQQREYHAEHRNAINARRRQRRAEWRRSG